MNSEERLISLLKKNRILCLPLKFPPNPLFIKYIFTVFKKILHSEYIVKVTASKQVCSQWNIAKWRNENKKRLRISDTQFVRYGIIITKWRNEHKKRVRISDTQFVRNGIIITKWRNEQIKRLQVSVTHFVRNGIIITKWWSNLKAVTTKFWKPFCLQWKNLRIYSSISHIFSLYTIQPAT
jgi:hypothetical protein